MNTKLSQLLVKLSWISKEVTAAEEEGCSEETVAWLKQRMKLVEQEIVESDADLYA